MEALTGVLQTLKLDHTIWIQLGCFVVAYLALSNLIFKPYYKVLMQRKEQTTGGTESAERLVQEAGALTEKYELRAREINAEFKAIYDQERASATKAYGEKVAAAREGAQALAENIREKVSGEVKKAKGELSREVPQVSAAIASKLIGKEVTQ